MPGVYYIKCVPTGDLYVGGTRSTFNIMFQRHRACLRAGTAPPLLQSAWDKHGPDAFEFVAIKEFPEREVFKREKEAIERLRPALNICFTDRSRTHLASRIGITWQGLRYRQEKSGKPIDAPKYGPRQRANVRGEMLTVAEISIQYNLPVKLVQGRMNNKESGERMIRPLHVKTQKPIDLEADWLDVQP